MAELIRLALGHQRTFQAIRAMSALPAKADVRECVCNVR